jgi:hypothetical protein
MQENTMTWLSLLLATKITFTALLIAVPFLFLPKSALEKSTKMQASTPVFFRLYGVAIVALLVGYGFGIPAAEAGTFPWGVAVMGAVSNAGAAALLFAHARHSKANFLLGSFFCLIALGLVVAMGMPPWALQRAW